MLIPSEIIAEYKLKESKLLVAVSGGQDSVALLSSLLEVCDKKNLVVAHINHQLRENSVTDAKFVQDLCQKLGVKCLIKKANLKNITNNIEHQARQHRYQLLIKISRELQTDYILTAHHQEDQIETVILNYTRGSSWRGLRGIAEFLPKEKILRPLLKTSKKQIQAYYQKHKLRHQEDPTNFDLRFKRNKLRNVILPQLRQADPNYNQTVLVVQEFAVWLNQYLLPYRLNSLIKCRPQKNNIYYQLDCQTLNQLELQLLIYEICRSFKLPTTKATIGRLIKMSDKNSQFTHKELLIQSYQQKIYLAPKSSQPKKAQDIKLNNSYEWQHHQLNFKILEKPPTQFAKNKLYLNYNDAAKMEIRPHESGLKIQPLGSAKKQKLKKILINKKIPQFLRQHLPLIYIDDQLAGIPGVLTSENHKAQPQQTCLVITLAESVTA